MPKFTVSTEWSGYCRGVATYEVEATDENDARQNWFLGEETDRTVVRDDTETEVTKVTALPE